MSGEPPHPNCAAALGNRTKQNDAIRFTIPLAWLCHAVPPLHKGGFSLPRCTQPAFSMALGQDCKVAPTGVGSPAPEQKCKQRIKPSASFGSSVTLDFMEILQDALENFPFFRYDRDNTMERWGKTQKWEKPLSLLLFPDLKQGVLLCCTRS